jgi:hypothetical protein
MPYKTINAPRKLQDLNAEVRAAACLLNPGMVAMLSASPARLATLPMSGSGGKVTNISLDGADGVALLSRDVAVVRGSDDSAWALLDITHTPKMDQVARDVRSLCMRPGGETALTIGWDGSASELKLKANEVEARQFALRGTVRACDVGETETYVVVDGADGGQLRVHPGATPEPGASLRANLPSEAAKLDRVRGGPRLVAVFKPGSTSVCVATGGPAKLNAKMVQLPSAPADVGVLETSLFVATEDGRIALYDADAIANASSSGTMEARHTLTLGGRGEPKVLLTTSKGGAALWIGTTAGEIYTATVAKKGAI